MSIPIPVRPNALATPGVVPVPEKGSRTVPFSGQKPRMIRRGHSVGNAAKWSIPSFGSIFSGSVGMVQTLPGSLPSGLC